MGPAHGLRAAARTGTVVLAGLVFSGIAGVPTPVVGQALDLSGYYLHAAGGSESSPFSASGAFNVQRLRLMTRPTLGPVRLQVAWETTLTLRSDRVALGRGLEGAEPAAPWLDLQGTLVDQRRVSWAHGLDRLNASVPVGERGRVTIGRQTVSWGATLYFSPADPFVPFDPADPFREYRSGVDAVRAVVFTGPLSEVEGVVRPAPRAVGGETWTALLRAQRLLGGWELSAWGGMLHDEAAGAVTATGAVGKTALRSELSVRDTEDGTIVRIVAGLDRWFELAGRDLHGVIEAQYDGFGARRPDELLSVAASAPVARGEMATLGARALMVRAAWQLHPLTAVSLLSLMNTRDPSALVSPGLEHSVSDEIQLRVGAFAGLGPGSDGTGLRSEYGAVPLTGFAAFSVFF